MLDIVYWLRQVLAVMLGVAWGLLPLQGIGAFACFMVALMLGTVLFVNRNG